MNTQDSRIVLKRSSLFNIIPTTPSSSDHTDGTWLSTDIYIGEAFLQEGEDRLFIRSSGAIYEVKMKPIYNVLTTVGTGADTNLTTLQSYTIPKNTLINNADRIRVRAVFVCASNTNSKTVSIVFGTDTFSYTTTTSGDTIIFQVDVERITATTHQAVAYIIANSASKPVGTSDNISTTWANSLLISAKGQNGVATANDITCTQLLITL